MIYFGQEVGEPGAENAGFGSPTRTSIFDYIGVPHHQRWMNNGVFDGAQLSSRERNLREFYKKLLNFSISSTALMGEYQEIHFFNKDFTQNYNHRIFSFVRWSAKEKLIIVSNFDAEESYEFELQIPENIITAWNLKDGTYQLTDQLNDSSISELKVEQSKGFVKIKIDTLESFILKVKN
jgi:glycosidase